MSSTAQYQFAAEFVTFLACARRARGGGVALGAGRPNGVGAVVPDRGLPRPRLRRVHARRVGERVRLACVLAARRRSRGAAMGTIEWHGPPAARRLLWLGLGLGTASLVDRRRRTPTSSGRPRARPGGGRHRRRRLRRQPPFDRGACRGQRRPRSPARRAGAFARAVDGDLERRCATKRCGGWASGRRVESALIENRAGDAIRGARLSAVSLQTAAARRSCSSSTTQPQRSALVDDALRRLSDNFLDGLPLAYLSFDRTVLASYKLDQREVALLAGDDAAVGEAIRRQTRGRHRRP